MTHRHKPYRESRTIPVNSAEMQQLVKEINITALLEELDGIVPEGEQPQVKVSVDCPCCGSFYYVYITHEEWIDNDKQGFEETCKACRMFDFYSI